MREIEIAARLTHPHILPVYDSGEAAGFLFYVMPYVEGESLRERLRRNRQLPIDEALRLTCEVADALGYAHGRGIVHRDIKPENILLEAGHAVVADLGIARAVGAVGREALTETGFAIGTPAYMSPEQVTGSYEVDGRSDLYALGCVLYEMLGGEPPYTGRSAEVVISKRLSEPVPHIRTLRETVPEGVEAAIMKALARSPMDRFATATEFAAALQAAAKAEPAPRAKRTGISSARKRWRVAVAGAMVLLLVFAAAAYALVPAGARATFWTVLTRPAAELNPRRIVVAPLENRTGDPALDALGDMASDWMTRELAATGELEVVDSRTSLLTAEIVGRIPNFLRPGSLAVALAHETGSGTVVSGAIYRGSGGLQAEVRVADVASGKVLRAVETVTGSADQPVDLVAGLARRTVAAIGAELDWGHEGTGSFASVGQPPSYEAFREARLAWESYFRRDRAEFFAHIARVTRLDSTYITPLFMEAQALADYGEASRLDSVVRRIRRSRGRLTRGEEQALEVFEADLRGDLPGKLRAAQEMIRSFPGSAEVPLLAASEAIVALNRPHDALAALAQTDPTRGLNVAFPHYWRFQAGALHALGQHDKELESIRLGLRQFPGHATLVRRRLRALGALGRVSEIRRRSSDCRKAPTAGARCDCELQAVMELRSHGYRADARRLAESLISRFAPDRAEIDRQSPWVTIKLLCEGERWSEAAAVAKRLVVADSNDVDARGLLGLAAVHLEDRARGWEAIQRLSALDRPYLYGRHLLWQAKIAAALGRREQAAEHLRLALQQGLRMRYDDHDAPWPALHTDADLAALQDPTPVTSEPPPRP